ncbi:MAG: 50S ribosomal protein L18 [Candidatus Woesebacteria bacterium]|jgi:large subunit ribosomal protein L18
MVKVRHNRTSREKKQLRVRAKISRSAKHPKLVVFRSNKHIYLQVVDKTGKILLASSDLAKKKLAGTKTEKAQKIASDLLAALKKKKIRSLVFDRSYYKYHGRIKMVADTLREGGIKI